MTAALPIPISRGLAGEAGPGTSEPKASFGTTGRPQRIPRLS